MHRVRTVKIKVAKTKLPEGLIERRLDKVRLVERVPEFGGDKELLAGDDGRDDFLEYAANPVLILICLG